MLAFIFSATGSQSTKWMLEIWHFLDRIKMYFLGGMYHHSIVFLLDK